MARGEGKITASELHHSVTDILDKVDILSGGDTKEKVNKEDFNAHISNKSNPHGVSKNDVGLGNVENYGIATKSDAEAGTSNSKYMTPLRVKEAMDKLGVVTSVFSGILDNTSSSSKDLSFTIPLGKVPGQYIRLEGQGVYESMGVCYIDIAEKRVYIHEVYEPYDKIKGRKDSWNLDIELYQSVAFLDAEGSTNTPRIRRMSISGDELIITYDVPMRHNVKLENLLVEVL